jgi:hypothetical protein
MLLTAHAAITLAISELAAVTLSWGGCGLGPMWPAAAGWLSLPRQMSIPPTFGGRADIPIRLA